MTKAAEKRLFIGIPCGVDLKKNVSVMLKKLKVNADQKEIFIKWTPTENLHLTLNFLGHVDSQKVEDISESVSDVVTLIKSFDVKLRGLGGFPDENETRVIWMGVQNKIELRDLQFELQQALSEFGVSEGSVEFTPHITIGRLRNKKNVKDLISPFVRHKFGELSVNSVALYESQLHGNFPVYKVLRNFPLSE